MIKSSTIALSSECCFCPRFPASFPANCFYWFCTIISHLAFFKLINPNLHRRDSSQPRKLSDDFSNSRFCFINDTRKTPKHPLNLPRSQFFFCFLLLCCWKRKLTHRWRGRQTMCNFDISGFFFSGMNLTVFFSLLGKQPRVALSLLQTIMTFCFLSSLSMFWWIFIRPIHDVRVRKSRWDNL